ncbi:hypothetical protein H7J73_16155 [Mycolicibacterium komossense]|uniref:Uncharacterized protein n=2 Tax=Mycolicibacterium komossense TaxID=1779 RepID=A0ABT3CDU0_9MYCO|nr:hypothetical protein [Mycolicibacterium komossense]
MRRLTAGALMIAGASVSGLGIASADPGDYTGLLVHPNTVTDSDAYSSGAPILDPNGQQGAQAVYNHRDGSRAITDTVLVLADPTAATDALNAARAGSGIANPKSQPAPVGVDGTILTGTGANGQSVSLLLFTQGNTATTVEFTGPGNDPAPQDLVVQFGQQQDSTIKGWQAELG